MGATVIVGGLFGDEGKGKVVSYLALKDGYEAVVRAGVGPNAGHTVIYRGEVYRLRMVPSAFVNPKTRLMIAPGVLIDPDVLIEEIRRLGVSDRIMVDERCGVIEEAHKARDRSGHLKDAIGTTGSGTGPANADRALRSLKLAKEIHVLSPYLGDVPLEVNKLIDDGKDVMVEGTQGTFLSLYHGTYPYVTSKDVGASAACSDVGIGPKRVSEVIVVFKSYVTRVGEGPLAGELNEQEAMRRGWVEVGTVTGRVRRVAPFDFQLARRACMLNSATQVALTKLDALYKEVKGAKSWEELPHKAKCFVEKVENELRTPVTLIGTGEDVNDIVDRRA